MKPLLLKTKALIFCCLLSFSYLSFSQTQIGSNINGQLTGVQEQFGTSVGINADGTIVAIGAPNENGFGVDPGHVQVYQNIAGTWSQIGEDIIGESAIDIFGTSVSINANGDIVAIGAPYNDENGNNSGHVRIFQNIADTWTQIGLDIDGDVANENLGHSVSISADGSIVAIGSNNSVKVYENVLGNWIQVASINTSGHSVSLSANGDIVAIGNPNTSNGLVQVYQAVLGGWAQIGGDIVGEAGADQFGYSLSLSSDGNILAIGATGNDGNGSDSGHVRVYENIVGTWTQIGADIDGENALDRSGWSVSLSSNGNVVAISAPVNDDNGVYSGQVRIYQNLSGAWTQVGTNINGNIFEYLGNSVSLNTNGSTVAIGAPSLGGFNSGHVRVYELELGAVDDDNDGFTSDVDCNDNNSSIFPGAPELCDSLDNNCDGNIDESPEIVDWANLQWPYSDTLSICVSELLIAYGQVYEAGLTDVPGQAPGISVQFGFHTTNIDPALWPEGNWFPASYNLDVGNNDEYQYEFNPPGSGTFYYTFRYSINGCDYVYGGTNNNFWDGGTHQSGILTVDSEPTWYADNDSDGYGDASSVISSCTAPSGYVANNTDCNDSDATLNPATVETCDGIDNNCNGLIDESSGNAISLDGVNDRVEIPDNDLFDLVPGESFTIELWARRTGSGSSGGPHIFGKRVLSCGSINYQLYYSIAGNDFVFTQGPAAPLVASAPFNVGEWTHIAITSDGTTISMYINGVLEDSTDLTSALGPTNSAPLVLGNSATCPNTYQGDIDEFRFWNVERTEQQINDNLYSIIDPVSEPNLMAYYPMNQGIAGSNNSSITFVDDITASNLDGAIINLAMNGSVSNFIESDLGIGSTTYYADADGDGYGDPDSSVSGCSAPSGFVSNNSDCDDSNETVFPGAEEICDGIDNNCDGEIDEEGGTTYYADSDDDGFGNPLDTIVDCSQPEGYVEDNTDCDDTDPTINPDTLWYADLDGDGFGDATNNLSQCTQPEGYVANNTDCDDTNGNIFSDAEETCDGIDNDCDGLVDDDDPDVTGQSTWYADSDGDGFGDLTNSTNACNQPSGFVANNTDCDDTNANVNPDNPTLQFSTTTNYTTALVYPLSGGTGSGFTFEVLYTDINNSLPPATFPRLLLDYEGNGSLNDSDDLTLIMTEADLNDTTTNDGKRYVVTVPALPAGTNWESSVQVIHGSCTTTLGPFNYPDVFVLPDLQIFANDIAFSNPNPDVSSQITVFATIHNVSDFDALNFDVHLENQAEPGITIPDITVPILPANSSITVSWVTTTPPTDGWNPMQVSIDYTDVIAETLENNNTAVRPFINGDYNVPGNIVLTVNANPGTVYNNNGNMVSICGNAVYTDTAIPLTNPSVAGATVNITIEETGASYTTYTNVNGNYCLSIPVPLIVGMYNVEVSITDFTLSANQTTSFEVIEAPCLPDLETSVVINENSLLSGQSVSGTITVKNIGCAATTISSLLDINSNGGTPVLTDETIPVLNPGETFTIPFSNITYLGSGSFTICAYADANFEIAEILENNNYGCAGINISPNLPDLGGGGGPGNGTCIDNAPTSITFHIKNSNTIATGAFTTLVNVYLDGGLLQTLTEHVPNGIAAGGNYSFTKPFSYSQTGVYEFEMIIDSNNDINEGNETNNSITFNQEITTCLPNLALFPEGCDDNKIDVSVDPVFPGTATYSAQIVNDGDGTTTGPFNVDFVFSGGQILSTTFNGVLSPGTNTTVNVDGPTVQSGTETLTVIIDPQLTVTELNENDNTGFGELCWDFSFDTTTCTNSNFWDFDQPINQPVYFSIGFDLSGLYDASAVDVEFEVSGPGITGTINAGTVTITDLESNCYCPYQANLPVPFIFSESGTYTVTATIDPTDLYGECDETNNVFTVEVFATDLPDMQILSQFINPSELNPDVGETVNIEVTYENIGASNVGDQMELCMYADGVLIETISNINGLLSGMNTTISLTSPYSSLLAGSHILSAKIDCGENINESNELNNESTRAIVVGDAGNLIFTSFIASNISPAIGENIDITAIIENEGLAEVEAEVYFYYTDNFLNEIQIAGPYPINLDTGQNTTLQFPWMVIDNNTTLVGKIVNSSPYEYNYDDNEAELQIGNLNITIESTPSCANEANGSITASVTGGTPPYSYEWNNGSFQSTITGVPGIYFLTVTDNTGFSNTIEVEILIETTDTDNDTISDCNDVCPGYDDLTDTDVDGIPDGCDEDDDNDGIIDENDCNPLDNTIGESFTWYADIDGDGFGDANNSISSCTQPEGYIENNTDCNDNDITVFPGAEEICDGIDNNCNGVIDDNFNSNTTGQITSLSLPADPVNISQQISGNATFENINIVTAIWDWGDGEISNGIINDNVINGNHLYTNSGVYQVFLTLTDICGESIFASHQYVVIYDPSDGFVTGGGWISSPEGAYIADPNLTGTANFGFVSKYKRGRSTPDGNTEFQFQAASLNFKSIDYEWLIIAGTKAMFKGSGTINNQGNYKFILTAMDQSNNNGTDKFRIKIWDSVTEQVVYDNQLGEENTADATTILAGGSIIIHNNNNSNLTRIIDNDLTFTCWPNPSKNLFNIQLKNFDNKEGVNIYVYDILGNLVHRDKIIGEKKYTFGENLEKGVFFVKLKHGKRQKLFKLIKY